MPSIGNLAIVIRVAFLALPLTPALARAQAVEGQPEKLSNDQPSRPIQMPAASSEAREAFDDFERFSRRGAWERATKALYAIPEAQINRFVDGPDGFIIPVARKRRAVLSGLSPEGQAAYRLFYDAEAKKLLDQAEGTAEQSSLEKLYSAYFPTSVGDNGADRLGDLYFEQGRFDRAVDCWLAILRERPDSDISPALMAVKAALGLARAGRKGEIEAIRGELADRFADEVVTLGGRKAKAAEHLRTLVGDPDPSKVSHSSDSSTEGPPPTLSVTSAAWQLRFAASVTAGMTPPEVLQWEANPFSQIVPPVSIDGSRLYANYLGHVIALELGGGKMLWRSSSFHNIEVVAMQDQARMIDPSRFAILASSALVWSLGRDLKNLNMQGTSQLICRRAETGELVWQTNDLADYAGIDLVGLPILAQETLFLAGKTVSTNGQDNLPRQFVLAIRPHDGKILWKTEVGMFRETQRFYYYAMRDNTPQPRLTYRSGTVYIDTHLGVLARLDAESGELNWGYGYPTEPIKGQSIFFFRYQPQGPTPIGAPPMPFGEALLIKGAKADRVCVVDPDRMKLVWDRPIARSARLLGFDDQAVYLGGPDLGALDRQARALRWSTPMPGGNEELRALVRPDGLWQLTHRGIYEVDPKSGRVRRIFRGEDPGASGGDLVLTDRWLLAISNRSISAYPRGEAGADRAAGEGPGATKTRGSDD